MMKLHGHHDLYERCSGIYFIYLSCLCNKPHLKIGQSYNIHNRFRQHCCQSRGGVISVIGHIETQPYGYSHRGYNDRHDLEKAIHDGLKKYQLKNCGGNYIEEFELKNESEFEELENSIEKACERFSRVIYVKPNIKSLINSIKLYTNELQVA